MMMAGSKLRVTLVTIHCPLREVADGLTIDSVYNMIRITQQSLMVDFGIKIQKLQWPGSIPMVGKANFLVARRNKLSLQQLNALE